MPKSTKQTGVLILRLIGIAIPLCAIVASQQSPRRISPTSDIPITRKMALVIGNSSYPKATLQNPKNDANAMAATLRNLGFQVTIGLDLTRRQMDAFTARFADSLQSGDLALFYYSGHGVQVGENYLIPIDYQASSAADLRYEAFPAEQVRDRLEQSPARVRIMILDACRDNPFKGTRGGTPGLKPMTSQAEGTLIAYATAENSTSDDNPREANGLYTKSLLSSLSTPGLSLKQIFEQTKASVWQQSSRTQRPYVYDGIVGDLVLSPAAARTTTPPEPAPGARPEPAPSGAAVPPPHVDATQQAWEMVKNSNNPDDLDDFAKQFPTSDLVPVAKLRAGQLRRSQAPAVTPAPQQQRLPEIMHWCRANCSTLKLKNGHYVVINRNGFESPDFSSTWVVESFTPFSVILHRTDTGSFALTETISGQISGDTLINAKEDGKPSKGRLAWGTALDTVPGSNQERDRRGWHL